MIKTVIYYEGGVKHTKEFDVKGHHSCGKLKTSGEEESQRFLKTVDYKGSTYCDMSEAKQGVTGEPRDER